MTHECEVIVTMCQILDEYSNELGPYTIGINHFQLLTAMLEACEVPRVQHATVYYYHYIIIVFCITYLLL